MFMWICQNILQSTINSKWCEKLNVLHLRQKELTPTSLYNYVMVMCFISVSFISYLLHEVVITADQE